MDAKVVCGIAQRAPAMKPAPGRNPQAWPVGVVAHQGAFGGGVVAVHEQSMAQVERKSKKILDWGLTRAETPDIMSLSARNTPTKEQAMTMTPWLNKITLAGFSDAGPADWPRYAQQLAGELPSLLKADGELMLIAEAFDDLDPDECCVDDFDDVLGSLYDWGDDGKRLWVETL